VVNIQGAGSWWTNVWRSLVFMSASVLFSFCFLLLCSEFQLFVDCTWLEAGFGPEEDTWRSNCQRHAHFEHFYSHDSINLNKFQRYLSKQCWKCLSKCRWCYWNRHHCYRCGTDSAGGIAAAFARKKWQLSIPSMCIKNIFKKEQLFLFSAF
jgi:hypothetical protein